MSNNNNNNNKDSGTSNASDRCIRNESGVALPMRRLLSLNSFEELPTGTVTLQAESRAQFIINVLDSAIAICDDAATDLIVTNNNNDSSSSPTPQ